MPKIILFICIILMFSGCSSSPRYAVYKYDNGDDYISEGLHRIVDHKGRIGYADKTGRTVIPPRFAFGYPFKEGKAKVTFCGKMEEVTGSGGEYWYWESDNWFYIDQNGNIIGTVN